MNFNFSDHRETISKNLVTFLRMNGYSKLSFSKLTNIPRPIIDQIFKGESLNSKQYNKQIEKINKTFNLPYNYFTTSLASRIPKKYTYSDHCSGSQKSPEVKELLDGLYYILDIYSLYIK